MAELRFVSAMLSALPGSAPAAGAEGGDAFLDAGADDDGEFLGDGGGKIVSLK